MNRVTKPALSSPKLRDSIGRKERDEGGGEEGGRLLELLQLPAATNSVCMQRLLRRTLNESALPKSTNRTSAFKFGRLHCTVMLAACELV